MDGNGDPVGNDGCEADCLSWSNDIAPQALWVCNDDGTEPTVCTGICGDGYLASPEACDDGNELDGDGCASTCTAVEPGYLCTYDPAFPVPYSNCDSVCGDGV